MAVKNPSEGKSPRTEGAVKVSRERIKFSELLDLVLTLLYDVEQFFIEKGEPVKNFPLDYLLVEFPTYIPRDWMLDIGKILESRGLAECVYPFGGGCLARITGAGRLAVEQDMDKHQRMLKKWVTDFSVKKLAQAGNPKTMEEERRPSLDLVKQIADALANDTTLSPDQRRGLKLNTQVIGQELLKLEPNRPLLATLMEPLSQVTSVAPLIKSLTKLFNQ